MKEENSIGAELLEQFDRAFEMLRTVCERIPTEAWLSSSLGTPAPAMIAYHTIESLDLYFSGQTEQAFRWGHRFRGPWWETPPEDWPSKAEIMTYLVEAEEMVRGYLSEKGDGDFLEPFALYDWSGRTVLGHTVYAIRHTMHHQGQLAALQSQLGVEGDTWR